MKMPISLCIENAKGEIRNNLNEIIMKYNLPASLVEGILNGVLCEIQSQSKIELLNAVNEMKTEGEEDGV